jgi:hypothetical protein
MPVLSAGRLRREATWSLAWLLTVTVIFAPVCPALAHTFTVNSATDAVDTNGGDGLARTAGGLTTLRAAIQEANALADADTINLPAGTYTLTIAGAGEDIAATGDPDVTDASGCTITGAGAASATIDGGGLDRVLDIHSGTFGLSGVTIRGGSLWINPSATANLVDCVVTANSADMGGGIRNDGTCTALRTRIAVNSALDAGGGVFNTDYTSLTNSLVDGNLATLGAGIRSQGPSSVVYLTNATLSGNSATSDGGGVHASGDVLMQNVTITGNSSGGRGGGTYRSNGSFAFQLGNVLTSGNTASQGPDAYGAVQSIGVCLVGSTAGSSGWDVGDLLNVNPLIGTLTDNGGATPTYALLVGSPAIDAGSPTRAPADDQRGVARPQGAGYDIGAFELISSFPFTIAGTVFEDANYGGGAGRSMVASAGVGQANADVELYDSSGAYVSGTNTDLNGNYSFTGVTTGTYYVRVVTDSVRSSRTGWSTTCKPVLTYRSDASTDTVLAVTDFVGGTTPSATDPGKGSAGAAFNTSTFVFTAVLTGTAQAITKCMVSASSIAGIDFGFNHNTVVNTNNSGQGSLRQVITNANTLGGDASLSQPGLVAGKDNVVFMISNGTAAPGLRAANNYFSGSPAAAAISPASALPTINAPLVLDAQEQPGWTSSPVLLLDGNNLAADGLRITPTADGSVVCGLIIRDFGGDGVEIQAGADSITIGGSYIGRLNAGGTDAGAGEANGVFGLNVLGSYSTIGGTTATLRNVISGNNDNGIYVGSGATGNIITGNFIGTTATGNVALGNQSEGVEFNGSIGTQFGGTLPGAGNLVAASDQEGIWIINSATGSVIQGNWIGTDTTGTLNLGNAVAGIRIGNTSAPASNNLIGGTAAGAGNVIAFNTTSGVAIDQNLSGASVANAVLGNQIYANTGLGIDVDDSYANPSSPGVTVNDADDADGGGNNRQNFPVLTSAVTNGTQLSVACTLNTTASNYFRIEFFANTAQDGSGHGEGQTYLGFADVSTDANGNASTTVTLTASVAAGVFITATATKSDATFTSFSETSEFAANIIAVVDTLSVAVSKGTFAYGIRPLNQWLPPDSAFIINDGTVVEDFVARISQLTDGTNIWAISPTANGADSVRAQWSTTSATGPWTNISAYASDFTIATGVAASDSVTLWLRIQTPTATTSYQPYSSTLTVTAQ